MQAIRSMELLTISPICHIHLFTLQNCYDELKEEAQEDRIEVREDDEDEYNDDADEDELNSLSSL